MTTFSPRSVRSSRQVHICTTWQSSSGIAKLWVNKKPLMRKSLRHSYFVEAHTKTALEQKQDSYGGKFDQSQSFVGETGDSCIWKSMLSPEEIGLCIRVFTSNILEWWALNYEMQIMCSSSSISGTEVLLQQSKDSGTEIHWQESSGDSYTSCPMSIADFFEYPIYWTA